MMMTFYKREKKQRIGGKVHRKQSTTKTNDTRGQRIKAKKRAKDERCSCLFFLRFRGMTLANKVGSIQSVSTLAHRQVPEGRTKVVLIVLIHHTDASLLLFFFLFFLLVVALTTTTIAVAKNVSSYLCGNDKVALERVQFHVFIELVKVDLATVSRNVMNHISALDMNRLDVLLGRKLLAVIFSSQRHQGQPFKDADKRFQDMRMTVLDQLLVIVSVKTETRQLCPF